ncbi:hypothetical protein AAVH_36541 [Aphelenchoides avenae]|nr:hypothetical protein AAVH_36541 [Aphelenchus avenae]
MEQESAQSTRREQLAAPPAEHDGSTRKRTATQASEKSQSKKANIPYGLEEEEPEDEDEEHVPRRVEPGREKKAETTNKRDSAQKSVRILPNMNGPVQAEEVGREKEVNAREPPDATAHTTQQSITSTSSATRRYRQPTSGGRRISLDELEEAVANMEFRRDEENKIRVACPYCDGKEFRGWVRNICTHFVTHLRIEDRPYLCPQDDCEQTSIQLSDFRTHFEGRHKELTWNDEIAKECEVAPNRARLNEIKRIIEELTRQEKLSFEELENQAKGSTLERELEGRFVFHCSVCELAVKVTGGRSVRVGQHLSTHLANECLPFACPTRDCKHATTRLSHIKEHFQSVHKELEWTVEVEKESAVTEHAKRLDAIVHRVLARNPAVRGLSLDDLRARQGSCTFTRDAEGTVRMKCSLCSEQIKADKRSSIRHLMSHLRHSCLPLRCTENECQYTTSRIDRMRIHFRITHEGKELTKKMEKDCEVIDNKKQLDAIVASIFVRRPRSDS